MTKKLKFVFGNWVSTDTLGRQIELFMEEGSHYISVGHLENEKAVDELTKLFEKEKRIGRIL